MNEAEILTLLQEGDIHIDGRITWGSNQTLLATIVRGEQRYQVIYKPRRGERGLWDFSTGTLCLRERAAYLISAMVGWNIVPPTILRQGPLGYGSVQWFVDHDPNQHYFTFQGDEQFAPQLQQIVLFDFVINNADRKGGHVLKDAFGRLWAIDHGICFHEEDKLRSVIWEFHGQAIPDALIADLSVLQNCLSAEADPLSAEVATLLNEAERLTLLHRVAHLLAQPTFPEPQGERYFPWPPI